MPLPLPSILLITCPLLQSISSLKRSLEFPLTIPNFISLIVCATRGFSHILLSYLTHVPNLLSFSGTSSLKVLISVLIHPLSNFLSPVMLSSLSLFLLVSLHGHLPRPRPRTGSLWVLPAITIPLQLLFQNCQSSRHLSRGPTMCPRVTLHHHPLHSSSRLPYAATTTQPNPHHDHLRPPTGTHTTTVTYPTRKPTSSTNHHPTRQCSQHGHLGQK